jgi:phosphomethylpyrimidine synthase
MTQMSEARAGRITPEMRQTAQSESIDPELIRERVAAGTVAILKNRVHDVAPVAVGKGLRTKVNANIGTSTRSSNLKDEIEKAKAAVAAGADAIMDLSTGGDVATVRRAIMKDVPVVIGTVPVYEAAVHAVQTQKALIRMTEADCFEALERQAKDGVDFFTIHCGVTRQSVERLKRQGRLMDVVSRGGSFLITWMTANDKENPYYLGFDRILEIASQYDITLSLGDGMRPGSIIDATDRAQIEELIILGELTQRAWDAGVQVMIEGPGHVPIDQIETNIRLQKALCHGAPFYVLGPLVTDVAPGYDHITSAIGGAMAAYFGADFLCYVTPGEHLRLPDAQDVHQGVIAARIAAHAADIAKGVPGAREWDRAMSEKRKALDWKSQIELAIDPDCAARFHGTENDDQCSMCGDFCAIKLVRETLGFSGDR